ncbi:MAG: hypothetical protein ACTSYA_10455, partial [Candidatus Kariarchaeaceae archaeon]
QNEITMFLHNVPLFSKTLTIKHNLRLHISNYCLSKEKRKKLTERLQETNLLGLMDFYPEKCTKNQLLKIFFIMVEIINPETLFIQELSTYLNIFEFEYINDFLNKREESNQISFFSW